MILNNFRLCVDTSCSSNTQNTFRTLIITFPATDTLWFDINLLYTQKRFTDHYYDDDDSRVVCDYSLYLCACSYRFVISFIRCVRRTLPIRRPADGRRCSTMPKEESSSIRTVEGGNHLHSQMRPLECPWWVAYSWSDGRIGHIHTYGQKIQFGFAEIQSNAIWWMCN